MKLKTISEYNLGRPERLVKKYNIIASLPHRIAGILQIYEENGEFNGYDWNGPPLNDDDLQTILDVFAEGTDDAVGIHHPTPNVEIIVTEL